MSTARRARRRSKSPASSSSPGAAATSRATCSCRPRSSAACGLAADDVRIERFFERALPRSEAALGAVDAKPLFAFQGELQQLLGRPVRPAHVARAMFVGEIHEDVRVVLARVRDGVGLAVGRMRAMQLGAPGDIATQPLALVERPVPEPATGEVLVRVEACGVCRTDLHVVEGELAPQRAELVPGHQIVGRIERCGAGVTSCAAGDRVGIAWLHRSAAVAAASASAATRTSASSRASPAGTSTAASPSTPSRRPPSSTRSTTSLAAHDVAPLLCAGIIGYRAFARSRVRPRWRGSGSGASAPRRTSSIQIARHRGCEVFAFSRAPRARGASRARSARAWAGGSFDAPPALLDAAIVFAPAGELVPVALERLDRGGTLALAGIHLSDVPAARLPAPSLPGASRHERHGEHARATGARCSRSPPRSRSAPRRRSTRSRAPTRRSPTSRRIASAARPCSGSGRSIGSTHGSPSSRRRPLATLLAPAAFAGAPAAIPIGPNSRRPVPGRRDHADRTWCQGQFPVALMGSYVMLPFEVPPGTTQVRVKYCWEPTDRGSDRAHRRSRALAGARRRRRRGASRSSAAGAARAIRTSRSRRRASRPRSSTSPTPKGYLPGRTTRGFLPGAIPAGTWAVELGVGAVVSVAEGDEDGLTDWRVEIELSSDPAFAADPYVPAPYDTTPANAEPGWYAGDLHVHGEHSALGDATMTEVFAYAFAPIEEGGAGLDFISLTDYVTSSGWGEIGRYQPLYPGKLILRGSEIITYHGHSMNHASAHYVDHRVGSGLRAGRRRRADAAARDLHAGRATSREIQADGGFTQMNHPTHCPSDTAVSAAAPAAAVRGTATPAAPATTHVDGIEVQSGSLFSYAL